MSFTIENTTISSAVNKSVYIINKQNTSSETLSGPSDISTNVHFTYLTDVGGYTSNLSNGDIGKQKTIIVTGSLVGGNITISYTDGYGTLQSCEVGIVGDMLIFNSTSLGWQLTYNSVGSLSTVLSVSLTAEFPSLLFTGNVTSEGGSPVTEKGVVWKTTGGIPPNISDNKVVNPTAGLGSYSLVIHTSSYTYARAYSINSSGITYGDTLSQYPYVCLAKGTSITFHDGTTKPIENIEYSDSLKVWNFDEGCFDNANPLWIKVPQIASEYNLLEFSDGSELKTIGQHRIFNKELGKFTYPMTDETPVGTNTFNLKGEEVTLTNKKVVHESVEYYNIITKKHFNMFANNILTSGRFNNIYPIFDMKFVKYPGRKLVSRNLRLYEQPLQVDKIIEYLNHIEKFRK